MTDKDFYVLLFVFWDFNGVFPAKTMRFVFQINLTKVNRTKSVCFGKKEEQFFVATQSGVVLMFRKGKSIDR